jgi:hypothetical protein
VAIDPSSSPATEAMARVVYLPVSPEVPAAKLDELARLVEAHGRARLRSAAHFT